MFIKKLYLHNFRGFDEQTIEFKKRFSVVAGENGSGKTAILEGLCVALGGWLYGFDGIEAADKRNIYEADKRTIRGKVNTALLPQVPVVVKCEAQIDGQIIEWSRSITSRTGYTTYGGLADIKKVVHQINEKIYTAQDEDIILPIVAYYSAARLWNEPIQKPRKFEQEKIRLEGYKKAISFSNSIKDTMAYINTLAYAAEQDEASAIEFDVILSAIQKSIASVLPNSQVMYDKRKAQLLVIDDHGGSILYSRLSDGYRCIISLIADICRRMVTLNPQLKHEAIDQTPGVVLIDEIDLHLHPKWQKAVVSDIKRIFPMLQIIATTHSPFIIQSLENGELVTLNDVEGEYSGESIEDISEEIMGVSIPQYSKHKEEMYHAAKEYFAALNKVDNVVEIDRLKEVLDTVILEKGHILG